MADLDRLDMNQQMQERIERLEEVVSVARRTVRRWNGQWLYDDMLTLKTALEALEGGKP